VLLSEEHTLLVKCMLTIPNHCQYR